VAGQAALDLDDVHAAQHALHEAAELARFMRLLSTSALAGDVAELREAVHRTR